MKWVRNYTAYWQTSEIHSALAFHKLFCPLIGTSICVQWCEMWTETQFMVFKELDRISAIIPCNCVHLAMKCVWSLIWIDRALTNGRLIKTVSNKSAQIVYERRMRIWKRDLYHILKIFITPTLLVTYTCNILAINKLWILLCSLPI